MQTRVALDRSRGLFFVRARWSTVLSLTCGPAGNRTTTGSLSATECRDTNCTTRTTGQKPRASSPPHDAAMLAGSSPHTGGYYNQPFVRIHISGSKLICIDVPPDWMAMCCASLLLGQHACTNKATKEYPAQLVSTAIALCDVNDVEDA